ncbi:Uncharacterized protein SCF082_LOCUS42949 [Durusdinium trenchii]|uniref:Cyclic nucleotide-binding domain-containing protein n=1 Tax=Durusdinium trenchii TaxID=1381693 RepID=A0ABP0QSC0_9DINO
MCPGLEYLRELHPAVLDIQPHLTRSHATVGPEADTVCDVRALSRKALLRVLEKFPEEEEQLVGSGHVILERSESQPIRSDDSVFQLILASLSRAWAASTALEQASAGEGGFSQDFIRMLVDNMFEQPFMVNQAILVQGTPGTHLVVLVHGIVEIEANGMVVATVPGCPAPPCLGAHVGRLGRA